MSNRLPLIVGAPILALVAAACASTSATDAAEPLDAAAPAASVAPEEIASIDVKAGASPIGDVLVGPEGLTLYGFTNDVDALSTCYGTCADAWPPVIVGVDWTAGPGLDFGIFATTVREDGQLQLVAGQWPLYYFAGDGAPGDLKGQGSGEVWFAVDLDGRLIADPAAAAEESPDGESAPGDGATDEADASGDTPGSAGPAVVAPSATDVGEALVDAEGLTLYGFLDDADGSPSCDGACADAWPPLILDGPDLPSGLDAAVFSVAERSDGSFQLVAGRWPLYRFAGDGAAGDVNGQASGDVWFVAAPDGSLIGAPAADSADSADDDSRDY